MNTQTTNIWAMDTAHSQINFKVKHLVVTTLTGKFEQFEANVESSDADFTNANVSFKAMVNSINTGNADRDNHLKSDDFFNADQFPELTFTNGKLTLVNGEYQLNGNLTIRDVSKPVSLMVEYGGTAIDPWGNTKAGFEVNGKISRKDFNLKWNVLTEAGGAVVSDEVKLNLNIQLIKQ